MIKREATYCVAFCPTRFNGYLDRLQKIVHKIETMSNIYTAHSLTSAVINAMYQNLSTILKSWK